MINYRRTVCVFFLLVIGFTCYSQKEGDIWVVGLMPVCTLDFNINPVKADTLCGNFEAIQIRGGASISDNNGNLLFFSNGTFIYKGCSDTLDDGYGFTQQLYANYEDNGTRTFQDNLVIPKKDSTYYLMNYSRTDSSVINNRAFDLMCYHIIDMKANNGNGKLISKNNVLMIDTQMAGTQFTACRHANGRDWWVVKSAMAINKYYKFLVTPDTIIGPIVQTISNDSIAFFYSIIGQSAFSPNGDKFAQISPLGKLVILNFDRCTGEFSPFRIFWANYDTLGNQPAGGMGVSFSPNGRFIYFNDYYNIFQYDLLEPDTLQALMRIGIRDTSKPWAYFTSEWLGPDGRIYIDNYQGTIHYLHYIENPDVKGVGCNFCQACLDFPTVNVNGIQNQINFRLGREVGSACDTIYNDILKPLAVNTSNIKLIPNPANDVVKIEYGDIGSFPATLQVIDAIGQIVYRQQLQPNNINYTLDTSLFNEGIYLVTLSNATQQITGRLSIVH